MLEAQQHQLQLQMQAAGQAGLAHLAPAAHQMPHHMAMSHALPHASNPGREPSQLQVRALRPCSALAERGGRRCSPVKLPPSLSLQAEQSGHSAPAEMMGASEFQDSHSQQTAAPHSQPPLQTQQRPGPVAGDQLQQVSAGSAFEARSEEHERDKTQN